MGQQQALRSCTLAAMRRLSFLVSVLALGCSSPVAERDGGPDGAMEDDAPASASGYGLPVRLGALSGVPETSGIVASRRHEDVFWVHNDSGNAAEIFAIDGSANLLATIALPMAVNQDWEDITLLPGDASDVLLVGDHGDNLARTSGGTMSSRSGTIRIDRLSEPDPLAGDASLSSETLLLSYPDGPHDCEAMFGDPATGDLWLISKVDAGDADVYVARAPFAPGSTIALEHVTSLSFLSATAADLSPDGTRLALRNYGQIRVFPVTSSLAASFANEPWRPTRNGSPAEAIAFGASGYDLFTIAEGEGADLFRIPWE